MFMSFWQTMVMFSHAPERALRVRKLHWVAPEEPQSYSLVGFKGSSATRTVLRPPLHYSDVMGGCKCRLILSHWIFFISDGRKAFSAFLRSEYSQENIEFWKACEEFKQTSDKMNLKAKKIFEQYVEADSPNEVRTRFRLSWKKKHLWNVLMSP